MTQTVNVPLLRKAVEWAEAEAAKPPELCEWEQRLWSIPPDTTDGYARMIRGNRAAECGTTYCIAGYVCEVLDLDHQGEHGKAAAAALGIPYSHDDPSRHLFDANNTIEDVRRIAEEIAGERL